MVLGIKGVFAMKKKIFLFLLPILLLTGCTVNYNLTINENSIVETISGTAYKSDYEIKETDTDINLFYTLINDDVTSLIDGSDLYTKDIENNNNGIDYNYTYNYKKNFDKSRIINTCFENHYIDETDEYYSIKLSGEFYCLYADKININVTSNYEVIDNNAKSIDGNKYKWVIDKSNNVDISLTVSKNVRYEEPVKAKLFSTFQIVGLIVFAVLVIITYILYKRKNSGKV